MTSMNRAIFIGIVSRLELIVANDQRRLYVWITTKDRKKIDGAWVGNAELHRVVANGLTADFLGRHAREGDLLAVNCLILPSGLDGTANIVVDRVVALNPRGHCVPGALAGIPDANKES